MKEKTEAKDAGKSNEKLRSNDKRKKRKIEGGKAVQEELATVIRKTRMKIER